MTTKKPKYPLRPAELIGKKYVEKACIIDADNETIRRCATYEEAESVAMIMNHVQAVWERRFRALERKVKRRASANANPKK